MTRLNDRAYTPELFKYRLNRKSPKTPRTVAQGIYKTKIRRHRRGFTSRANIVNLGVMFIYTFKIFIDDLLTC
jgi:hypothetical protein